MIVNTSQPHAQITPAAFFVVKCACGYAHDAFSDNEADALLEVQARHVCTGTMTATAYTCREHQVIGKCRECEK